MSDKEKEETIRKILNHPKFQKAIEKAYQDAVIDGESKIDVDELIEDVK